MSDPAPSPAPAPRKPPAPAAVPDPPPDPRSASAASDSAAPGASAIIARLLADPRFQGLRLARDLPVPSSPRETAVSPMVIAEHSPEWIAGEAMSAAQFRVIPEKGRAPALPSDFGNGIPDCAARSLRSLEYVVVDVETTGGSIRGGHRITEVAAIRVGYDGTLLDEYTTLVNPERPITPFVSALTNITWDMVRDAPRFAEIAPAVARILDGGVFVAHNAAFDWRFISHEFEWATGMRPDLPRLCTVRLARKVVPEVASRSLDSLAYFFGLANLARHRAYGDARVTADLLGRLLARVDEREIVSWGALEELLGMRKRRRARRRQAMPTGMDPRDIPAQ